MAPPLTLHRLILTYLIPCHLLTTHTLPSAELLAPHPRLQALFTPLATCIRRGDLAGFDEALSSGEDEFVKRRIYLTLERGRDICMRNLFRKVFIAGGYEELKEGQTEKDRIRRTRVPIQEFEAAVHMAMGPNSERLDRDEVECFIANMIYKVSWSLTTFFSKPSIRWFDCLRHHPPTPISPAHRHLHPFTTLPIQRSSNSD